MKSCQCSFLPKDLGLGSERLKYGNGGDFVFVQTYEGIEGFYIFISLHVCIFLTLVYIIQGVFFTGPPPKKLEYGKLRLGEVCVSRTS